MNNVGSSDSKAGNCERPLVVFTPSGRRGHFAVGTTVLEATRTLGVDLDSVCGGRGICGRCQVLVSEGTFAKHGIESKGGHLSPFSQSEASYHSRKPLAEGRRLGCHSKILGDLVIDIPPDSQVHRQVVRKGVEAHDIQLNPLIHLHYVEVPEPDMHDPASDLRRLEQVLETEWGLEDLSCDLHVLEVLQTSLRQGNWKVTVAVHAHSAIIAIWPGFHDQLLGMAVDVGSTTIAAQLCDLTTGDVLASAGMMNPQIRFGEDLMSRVSYVMMHPGGEKQMTAAVRKAIARLEREVCYEAGVDPRNVLDITFVGNPIMHHLLLGISPVELGGAPFALSTDGAVRVLAKDLELGLHPGARVYVLPCIAGHVGADSAGVVLCEAPHLREDVTLLVDVGTNAEIVLGSRHRLLAASSPTGPAFEGAQISCGQRAAAGAIERVRIDRETLVPRFKVIGCELWSNEEGFATAADSAGITGICGSGIIEAIAEMFLAGILTKEGIIRGELSSVSTRIIADGRTFSYLLHDGNVTLAVTQNDVRAIQLAKAALYAGIRLLMDHLKIDRVDRIRLAGAFGSRIDVVYAMVLGMIPDCKLSRVTSAGNAAGTGARVALLDQNARTAIERLVRQIEKIETAVETNFQAHFVEAMAIPHQTAQYPELSQKVDLPVANNLGDDSRVRRRGQKRRRAGAASR